MYMKVPYFNCVYFSAMVRYTGASHLAALYKDLNVEGCPWAAGGGLGAGGSPVGAGHPL